MYKQITFEIEGIVPTIMHNGHLADPVNPIVKEIKKISSKRSKTDDDYETLRELEWVGGIYTDKPIDFEYKNDGDRMLKVTCSGSPVWPGENVEAMILQAAAKNKLKTKFKPAVLCDGMFPIMNGKKLTIENMFKDDSFFDTRAVVVKRSRIMRTRIIINEWKMEITVHYLPDQVDRNQIEDVMQIAGTQIGLSDNRPKFGRFVIKNIK